MLPVSKKESLARARKTKEFKSLAKEFGFSEGESHSEFVFNGTKINICFYPCNYGVKITKPEEDNPHYQNFDITKSEFIKILNTIKEPK